MTGQIVIQSPPVFNNRRQPLLPPTRSLSPTTPRNMTSSPPRDKRKVGECAGGTAAECAAICCCCPFVLMEFMVLAVYKVPAGICRRIRRKRLLRKNKKKRLSDRHAGRDGGRSSAIHSGDDLSEVDAKDIATAKVSVDGSAEAVDLDKEMWERFRNTGFWRSSSQRHL